MLIQLSRAGLIDRLKKCAWCGIWLFSRGKFCSKRCRKAKSRSESKEKIAKYAGRYYRENLSPHQEYYRQGKTPLEVRELLSKRKNRMKGKRHGKKR